MLWVAMAMFQWFTALSLILLPVSSMALLAPVEDPPAPQNRSATS